ncbi:MAG: FeoB-associated Cys-rich membrane protein [Desulfarculaceae bacterium]|nr:FeoB-associated Cys-rich membrane protein [Desulfarculaceae bacterium]MCF8073074.1 FeoB-associated Cys-rich membrane protein [Desulfarculaceae bacterium]MCF8101841.1 FeoB-associated Cys-rich membrane protein [Desulfarculaceae bacterium]MCF8115368.1 FeoB-associated Cys-rich membrane protein [Desulfarculaceae bacterium]
MWQAIIVALAVAVAAWFVGRRLLRAFRPKGPAPSCGCGCGGDGPCHQIEPLGGPAPQECGSCAQKPPTPLG